MNMKRWIGVLTAVGLMLSSIGVAYAQEAEEGTRRGFVGTVSSYSGSTLVIEVVDQAAATSTLITITNVTEDKIKVPGQPAATDVAGALEPGSKVAVLAQKVDDTWEAVQVIVKPTAPTFPPVVGAVVSVEDGVLQIMLPNGEIKTIQLPPQASAPGIGEVVTAFSRGTGGEDDGDGPPVVTGLVRASQVSNRLIAFIDEATTDTAGTLDDLADLVVSHAAHREEMLTQILAKPNLPDQAKAGITNALAKAQAGRQRAQESATRARAKAEKARGGPPEGRGPNGVGSEGECDDGASPNEDGTCPNEGEQDGQGQGQGGQGQGQGGQGQGQGGQGQGQGGQ